MVCTNIENDSYSEGVFPIIFEFVIEECVKGPFDRGKGYFLLQDTELNVVPHGASDQRNTAY